MAEGQQPVDYAALAKQAGSVASTPAPSKVDYASLAKQAGSVASTPAPTPSANLGPGGIDPSKVAGASATGMGLPGAPPTPNAIQNPLSGMAKTPKDRAVAQSMENSSQQMENFNDAATNDTVGAVKGGVNKLKDWAKQPASFDKYVLQPGAAAINMGAAMVNLPYEAAASAVTGHPIEAAQTLLNSDEAKAQEFEKQGNEGGAAWERYGKPVAGLVAAEGLAPVLDMAGNVIRGTRFENNNLAAIMAPGFKGDELPQYAAADLMPYYKQEAAAQGLKDENFVQRMFTGDTPSRSNAFGKGPINETVKGMDKVRNVADQVVNRIDARVNGPKGVMEQAANDPVAPQTKQTILNGLEAEKATASRLGSRFDTAYDALIKQVEESDTYGKLNQIKKDSNNMIEGVLNGGPKENAAMSVEPIIAWKKAGDLIRQNMYPDLQRYVAPQGSPGYFSVADTGRLEGQAMSARDGIYANYKEAGHANLPEVAQKYLEGVTEGSLYKTHVIRRMLKILPTPAGEFNKTFRRGIGTLGEGSVPESVTPKKPQLKLPPPSSPDLPTMTPGQPVSFNPTRPPPGRKYGVAPVDRSSGIGPYASSKPVLPAPPSYPGEFNVPTGAPVEPTQITPRLPQRYLGRIQAPNPDYTPLEGPSHFQQQNELGYKNLSPGRGRDIPLPPNANSGQLYGGHVADTIPDSVRGGQSPARQRADQIGLGHVQGPAGQPGSAKPIAGINPPLRSLTGPETYTASNWQHLTGSAEPPQMVGHNGTAVMTTSDPSIAKSALDGMRNYQDTQGFGKLPKEEQKLHTDALDKLEKQYAAYEKWQAKNPLPPRPGVEPKFEVWLNPGKTGTKIASRMKSRVLAQGARLGVQGVLNGKPKAADMTPAQRKADDDRRQAEQDEIIRNYKEPQ